MTSIFDQFTNCFGKANFPNCCCSITLHGMHLRWSVLLSRLLALYCVFLYCSFGQVVTSSTQSLNWKWIGTCLKQIAGDYKAQLMYRQNANIQVNTVSSHNQAMAISHPTPPKRNFLRSLVQRAKKNPNPLPPVSVKTWIFELFSACLISRCRELCVAMKCRRIIPRWEKN